MAKTFINDSGKNILSGIYDKATDVIKKVRDLCADAIDEIVNLFEGFDINSIDIANYDPRFMMVMEDYDGNLSRIEIKKVELEDGTIYVYDTEGNDYTSVDWYHQAPALLQELCECLELKFKDIESLAVGKKVIWVDPEIEDYDEEDRQEVLDRVFTIYSCPDVIERDSVIGISCDGSEAEVLPMELVVLPD